MPICTELVGRCAGRRLGTRGFVPAFRRLWGGMGDSPAHIPINTTNAQRCLLRSHTGTSPTLAMHFTDPRRSLHRHVGDYRVRGQDQQRAVEGSIAAVNDSLLTDSHPGWGNQPPPTLQRSNISTSRLVSAAKAWLAIRTLGSIYADAMLFWDTCQAVALSTLLNPTCLPLRILWHSP